MASPGNDDPKRSTSAAPNLAVPNPQALPVSGDSAGSSGFSGLSHRDQRLAGTGAYAKTQFSLEPPDQGLCVGNGKVVEPINTAVVVYDTKGNKLSPATPLNQFFGLAPEVIRSTPPVYGDFTSDPKCYFDSQTNRWFLTVLQLNIDSSTGSFTGPSHIELAVSESGNPLGTWALYVLDVTDDGTNGTPTHANCPCFGDQPLIGADANGFYISTNEFPTILPGFNGAQVYAMSKQGVESGESLGVVQIDTGPSSPAPGCPAVCWYSIQPAISPPGGAFADNKEYFLSALDFAATIDNRIAFWALSGTSSLGDESPQVSLSVTVLRSEVYATPFPASQKPGPTPLGTLLGASEELINTNDDRMNQVVFADGKLWSGVNTLVSGLDSSGAPRTGIAYFIVEPGEHGARIAGQGYVSVSGENVIFPSIGVNKNGEAVMAFTLVGPDYFPSAAFVTISDDHVSKVHVAGAGVGPEDGFSGYAAFGSPTPGIARWGDYTAAVAGQDGSIWMGAEYIPGGPRTSLANWGTFIYNVAPQD